MKNEYEMNEFLSKFEDLERFMDRSTYDRVRLKSYIKIQDRLVTNIPDWPGELIHEIKDIRV